MNDQHTPPKTDAYQLLLLEGIRSDLKGVILKVDKLDEKIDGKITALDNKFDRKIDDLDKTVKRLDTDIASIKGESKWTAQIIWLPIAIGSGLIGALIIALTQYILKK